MSSKYIFTGYLFLLALSGSCQYKPPEITPLTLFNSIDTSFVNNDTMLVKVYTYIVKNYHENGETEKLIDRFVYNGIDTNFTMNTSIVIQFYKESSITNLEHLSKNKKDLDRYSNKEDMIYTYDKKFYRHQNFGWLKYKFKDGKLEPPSNIIVEDIAPK